MTDTITQKLTTRAIACPAKKKRQRTNKNVSFIKDWIDFSIVSLLFCHSFHKLSTCNYNEKCTIITKRSSQIDKRMIK